MKYANLNITNSTDSFNYIVEYSGSVRIGDGEKYVANANGMDYTFVDGDEDTRKERNLIRSVNEWTLYNNEPVMSGNIPSRYNLAEFSLYFPQFSVDTYEKNVLYALDVTLWMHGHLITLGSFLVDRSDALACNRVKKFLNNDYYETMQFYIPNPWDILYSGDWAAFRKEECTKELGPNIWDNESPWNAVGAYGDWRVWRHYETGEGNGDVPILQFSIHAVERVDDKFIKLNGYNGCQSIIDISNKDDILTLMQNHTLLTPGSEYAVSCSMMFNSAYGGNIFEYIKETYGFYPSSMILETVIQDDENIWKSVNRQLTIDNYNNPELWKFNIYDLYPSTLTADGNRLCFDSWDEWKWGMYINSTITIKNEDTDVLFLRSNKTPITPDIFKFMIKDNNQYINFGTMDNPTINIVNKNIQNIIQNTTVTNGKDHFIKPVFYRVQELANIIIHPEVTENICINLDAYKAKVNQFKIQIENTVFVETGRNNNGIIFKIVGAKLPKQVARGTYYILNDDQDMITNGKYTYEY